MARTDYTTNKLLNYSTLQAFLILDCIRAMNVHLVKSIFLSRTQNFSYDYQTHAVNGCNMCMWHHVAVENSGTVKIKEDVCSHMCPVQLGTLVGRHESGDTKANH